MAKFCYSRRNKGINNIMDEVCRDEEDANDSLSFSSISDSGKENEQENDAINSVEEWKIVNRKPRKAVKIDKEDKHVRSWDQYINGQGSKPKYPLRKTIANIPETVVNHPREVQDKALTMCRIEGRKTKVLFDTGATQNVISSNFFNEINQAQNIKVKRTNKILKCANNSRLDCLGNVILEVQIGNTVCRKIFTIVDQLSQKVIVGIRGMKASGIVVDMKRNGIFCRNEFIPFIGKISSSIQEN